MKMPAASPGQLLEILFAPHEVEPWLAVHVAFAVQLAAQWLGPAKEHACLGWRVDLADRLEHRVPIGPPKVGRRPEAGDGVPISVGVVEHDVRCVVWLDLGSEVL